MKEQDLIKLGLTKLKPEETAAIDGGNVTDDVIGIAVSVGNALVAGANWLSGWVNRNL